MVERKQCRLTGNDGCCGGSERQLKEKNAEDLSHRVAVCVHEEAANTCVI